MIVVDSRMRLDPRWVIGGYREHANFLREPLAVIM